MPKEHCTTQVDDSMFLQPLVLFLVALMGTAIVGCAGQGAATTERSTASPREDIFVLRSLREERLTKTDWCTLARTGFEPSTGGFLIEDRYSMWAVAVRPDDGQITDAKANKVGELHACFGSTTDPKVINFFTEGRVAALSFTGGGSCLVLRADFPEKGITPVRCFLELRDLPAPYTGGVLTTNTVTSRAALGDATDPPGYVQPSIATVRLWRTR